MTCRSRSCRWSFVILLFLFHWPHTWSFHSHGFITSGRKFLRVGMNVPEQALSALAGLAAFPEKTKRIRRALEELRSTNISTYKLSKPKVATKKKKIPTKTKQLRVRRKQDPREIHREINRVFPSNPSPIISSHHHLTDTNRKHERQSDVDKLIGRYLPHFDITSMSTLMYRSAKEWKQTKTCLLSRHLPAITTYISYLPAHEWTSKDISQAIYGLQYMKSDDHRVLKYLAVMTTIISSSLAGESIEFYDDDDDEHHEIVQEDDEDEDDSDEYEDDQINDDGGTMSGTTLDSFTMELLSAGDAYINGRSLSPLLWESSENSGGTTLSHITSSLSLSVFQDIPSLDTKDMNNDEELDTTILTAKEVTTILYSLRGMRSDAVEVRHFIDVLNDVIERSDESFDVQGIGNALYGLQGMSSDFPPVRRLIRLITQRIESCDESLDAQAIGNALYGLNSMSSDYPEVRVLVSTLADLMEKSHDVILRPQEIANALYGLQGMHTKHSEVNKLVVAIKNKILCSKKGDQGCLNAKEIAASLYGLQSMTSDNREVLDLLAAITIKMQHFKGSLNAQAVGNALWGLQGMGSEHSEVRGLVHVLTQHIQASDDLERPFEQGLFGLQRMNTKHREVRELLSILATKIDTCYEAMSKRETSDAIVGLQGMLMLESKSLDQVSGADELQELLRAFARHVRRSKEHEYILEKEE